jgi:hypothetical protein
VDIVQAGRVVRRVSVDDIKKAVTTEITRYGQQFSSTPFDAVLRLAAIAPGTRMRVVGEEDEMVLQAGSNEEDPSRYVVIFNMRGFPVLTPMPGGRGVDGGGRAQGGPQSGPGLPPAGSGGGNRGGTGALEANGALPPAGSGGAAGGGASGGGPLAGGRGARNGSGPGAPAGFGQLKEVRSFTRIEILN